MQLHEVLTLPAHHDQIQPLSRCPGCAQIYWPGSHVDEMLQLLARGPARRTAIDFP